MKKIIYSILAAFIINVILASIFPTWFLKEDSRWTYQSNTAHMDITFAGKIKKGRVKVEGVRMKAVQPKWLSTTNFQGTAVGFPVSYRRQTYQIKITPQADEWGQDTALLIKFRGVHVQQKGERKPAWVTFQNIAFNRQAIVQRQKVWYDQPCILKYPLHASDLTVTFDVSKPLEVSDFSFLHFLVSFFASMMLCLLFHAPLKSAARRAMEFIDRKDIVDILSDGYQYVDPVYRRSVWIIFGVLCFAFGFHTLQFMWSNHDWTLLLFSHRWCESAWEGRYMRNSIKALFSNGVFLPLIYDLLSFIALAIDAVLICRYWRLEKRVANFVLCGLVLTVQPFTLGMLLFAHMLPELFVGEMCALIALLLSEKAVLSGGTWIRRISYSLIAILSVNFALSVYPVLVNTIAVAFIGRLLVQSFDWNGTWREWKDYLKPYILSVVNVVLGAISYKLILAYFFPPRSNYNTDILPLNQVPERLGHMLRQSFHQLYEYDLPFLPQWMLWIFLGLTAVLTLYICSTGNLKQKIVRLFLLYSSLFATQAVMIIAKLYIIVSRIDLFGLVFFEVLVLVLLMTRCRKLHNVWTIIGGAIIFSSVINDLDCLRVWKLGFDAEKMLWNRILTRLETQPGFDSNKKYRIIQVGDNIALRKNYYTRPIKNIDIPNAVFMLGHGYDPRWDVLLAPEFYYPTNFRNTTKRHPDCRNLDYSLLRPLFAAGVLQKADVWPKPNGLIVWKDIILFVTDGKVLNDVRNRLKRELGNK